MEPNTESNESFNSAVSEKLSNGLAKDFGKVTEAAIQTAIQGKDLEALEKVMKEQSNLGDVKVKEIEALDKELQALPDVDDPAVKEKAEKLGERANKLMRELRLFEAFKRKAVIAWKELKNEEIAETAKAKFISGEFEIPNLKVGDVFHVEKVPCKVTSVNPNLIFKSMIKNPVILIHENGGTGEH